MKRILLIVLLAVSFLAGYAGVAKAWPGVADRAEHHGYFRNQFDNSGLEVWLGGIPAAVNTPAEFIALMHTKATSASLQDRVGAVFMVHTMLGVSPHTVVSITAAQWTEWEARVNFSSSQGWINWSQTISYSVNSFYQGNPPLDDAFYFDSGTDPAITFRNSAGTILYAIRRACANPVGNLSAIPDNLDFTISGRSTVNDADGEVRPGQVVLFEHYVRNNGPTNAPSVTWKTQDTLVPVQLANGGPNAYNNGQEINVNDESFTIPAGAAIGTNYCRRVGFNPLNETGNGGWGAQVCVTVAEDYNLTPQVQITSGGSSAQEGDSVQFSFTVTNGGPTISETINTCKPVGNNEAPGYTPLPQQDVDRTSDAGYVPPGTTCPRTFPVGSTITVATQTVTIPNLSAGSRVCRSLVLNPKDENGGFRASAEACVVIAKTPYVNFMGNDVWAGGGFSTADPTCDNQAKITTSSRQVSSGPVENAGSVVEYAAFALNRITDFGTASKAFVNVGDADPRALMFANSEPTLSLVGYYGAAQHCIDDYYDRFTATLNSPSLAAAVNVGTMGSGVWRVTGNHSFSGTMPAGATQVYIIESGSVTITGNLQYPDTFNGVDEIPSLIIISYLPGAPGANPAIGSITVNGNVTRMDGVFVAKNRFRTCDVTPSSVSVCNNILTINGSVAAQTLQLDRTAGAEGATLAQRRQAGEVFDFNPQVYLRNALNNSSQTTITTTDERELPPRF